MLIPFSFLIMGIIPVLITFVKDDSIIILIERFNAGITYQSLSASILTNTLFKTKHKKSTAKVNITFASGSFFASFEV